MPSVEDLIRRMRSSKAGWTAADLHELYAGLGFEVREGGKHRVYIHPKYPELRAVVTRSRHLATGYVQHALALVRQLEEREHKDAGPS